VKGYGELGSALNAFSLESQTASKDLDACGVLFDAIGSEGHEMIQNQLILGESIQLCQQFCGAIQVGTSSIYPFTCLEGHRQ
jgi:hypothetical protein